MTGMAAPPRTEDAWLIGAVILGAQVRVRQKRDREKRYRVSSVQAVTDGWVGWALKDLPERN